MLMSDLEDHTDRRPENVHNHFTPNHTNEKKENPHNATHKSSKINDIIILYNSTSSIFSVLKLVSEPAYTYVTCKIHQF